MLVVCLSYFLSGEWSSPTVIGTPPPPLYGFSFTRMDEGKVVMFGGYNSASDVFSADVYYFDIVRHVSDHYFFRDIG